MEQDATFLSIFKTEAKSQVQEITEDLLNLEKNPADKTLINQIFRNTHTLKGNASFDGLEKISSLAHTMESIFGVLRDNEIILNHEQFDRILGALDTLTNLIDLTATNEYEKKNIAKALEELTQVYSSISPTGKEQKQEIALGELELTQKEKRKLLKKFKERQKAYLIILRFDSADSGKSLSSFIIFNNLSQNSLFLKSHPPINTIKTGTTRVEFEEMKFLLVTNKSVEKIKKAIKINCKTYSVNPLTKKKIKEWKEPTPAPSIATPQMEAQILEVEAKYVDQLIETLGDVILGMNTATSLNSVLMEEMAEKDMPELLKQIIMQIHITGLQFNALMDQALGLRLVPIKQLFRKFPRIVRDLTRTLGKKAELIIEGERIRLGQKILDTLEAPILHLIRNSIDHGIEPSKTRIRKKKHKIGKIRLSAKQRTNKIIITLTDDGKGLDKEKIIKQGIKKGLIKAKDVPSMSEDEIFKLIFAPGFSTRAKTSMVSGRGVGMDVVLHNLQEVNGTVEVSSKKDKGSKFILTVPITI